MGYGFPRQGRCNEVMQMAGRRGSHVYRLYRSNLGGPEISDAIYYRRPADQRGYNPTLLATSLERITSIGELDLSAYAAKVIRPINLI